MCHQHEHKLENFHPLSNETVTQQQENRDEQNKAKEMAKIAFYLRMLRHFHAEKARTFNLEQQQKGSKKAPCVEKGEGAPSTKNGTNCSPEMGKATGAAGGVGVGVRLGVAASSS